MILSVGHTWSGQPLPTPAAALTLSAQPDALRVDVEAPYHGDPRPSGPPGAFWKLWEHEVVELFLLGDDERYLELELGPHGHHLALQLHGARSTVAHSMPLAFDAHIAGDRWRGRATVPRRWLPPGTLRANAYAIHGLPGARVYSAWAPVPGPQPDFHRLSCFRPLPDPLWPR